MSSRGYEAGWRDVDEPEVSGETGLRLRFGVVIR